jgi:hypothetical protein
MSVSAKVRHADRVVALNAESEFAFKETGALGPREARELGIPLARNLATDTDSVAGTAIRPDKPNEVEPVMLEEPQHSLLDVSASLDISAIPSQRRSFAVIVALVVLCLVLAVYVWSRLLT